MEDLLESFVCRSEIPSSSSAYIDEYFGIGPALIWGGHDTSFTPP
jgi:hypothetical protein